ncbi:MAG TPA: hypothetical protein DD420_26295 [Streptomyces sp.]|nr:hypothetical protein [Streptomyces sp.]
MIVILSALRSTLEEELAARHLPVLAVVPSAVVEERRSSAAGTYGVLGIDDWDSIPQLNRLADVLSALPSAVQSVETTDELCLRAAALLRGLLQLPGQSWSQALAATDKAIMKDLLRRAHVPVAEHRRLGALSEARTAGDELGWPVVIKPRRGFGTLGTRILRSPDELRALLDSGAFDRMDLPPQMAASGFSRSLEQTPGGVMAEQYVDVRTEYHVEILRADGEEIYAVPARYVAPLLGSPLVGSVLLQSGPEHDTVTDLARAAADTLELTTGFAHVEVLRDRHDVWRVGEIGLRPGGARVPQLLRLHHGIDVAALAADLATGQRPRARLEHRDHTTAWVSAVAPRGRVTTMTSADTILGLPGVIAATTSLTVGEEAAGALGTTALGTHVYAQGATAEEAEQAALHAITAWHVTTIADPLPRHRPTA